MVSRWLLFCLCKRALLLGASIKVPSFLETPISLVPYPSCSYRIVLGTSVTGSLPPLTLRAQVQYKASTQNYR